MSIADWIVLVATLALIILYGLYRSRTTRNMEGYFLSNRSMPWWLVLLSIMGTQASAITFLGATGQGFTSGMGFVQYYFGLPLAMIVISISFVPIFNKLKIFTAYEYLEQRFDVKTRTFTSLLFLLSRGFSTGISIYAPSIILSSLFGWNIYWTNLFMGGLLIMYTVSGGARAVAYTLQLQLCIIFAAMIAAGYFIVHRLPGNIGFTDALKISGAAGKLHVISTGITNGHFNWKDKYNLFSGIIGGFFLALSYFGTDQSQVGRYLTARNMTQSRLGLLMNGLVKIPMQFLILLLGTLVFTFYQFNKGPVFFNSAVNEQKIRPAERIQLHSLQQQFDQAGATQAVYAGNYIRAWHQQSPDASVWKEKLTQTNVHIDSIRTAYKQTLHKADASIDVNDTNYVFIRFVIDTLPKGLVGLLIAIVFLSAWGSIAAALNSLSSCTMVDIYCRFGKNVKYPDDHTLEEERKYNLSKWITLWWGLFSIAVSMFCSRVGSLIEAVNIFGSLFYGVILGIFLVAFYMKKIGGNAVFIAAVITEIIVVTLFTLDNTNVIGFSFLWLNVTGALGVMGISLLIHTIAARRDKQIPAMETIAEV
ncbi:sodium:solute symporter [Chitinophagaceae bacterium MMS25-I14]